MPPELIFEDDANGYVVGRCSECGKNTRFVADPEMRRLRDRIGQTASIQAQFDQHRVQKHLYDAETQRRIAEYKAKAGAAASPPTMDDASADDN